MASSSGTSSGSSLIQNSGSEGDLQAVAAGTAVDQRKQKRMLSNRESARRSRMRKQKHLDDLMAQVNHLRKENSSIVTAINVITQNYIGYESENSVLRTQMMELTNRLHSLNEIIFCMTGNNNGIHSGINGFALDGAMDSYMRPWSQLAVNHQPIMASADMFQYC